MSYRGPMSIEAEVSIERGVPARHAALAARKWKADLTLIRADDRADFRNRAHGSVARAVASDAPCSVEIVRARRDDSRRARTQPGARRGREETRWESARG